MNSLSPKAEASDMKLAPTKAARREQAERDSEKRAAVVSRFLNQGGPPPQKENTGFEVS